MLNQTTNQTEGFADTLDRFNAAGERFLAALARDNERMTREDAMRGASRSFRPLVAVEVGR